MIKRFTYIDELPIECAISRIFGGGVTDTGESGRGVTGNGVTGGAGATYGGVTGAEVTPGR
jgi:hypothetical protein